MIDRNHFNNLEFRVETSDSKLSGSKFINGRDCFLGIDIDEFDFEMNFRL